MIGSRFAELYLGISIVQWLTSSSPRSQAKLARVAQGTSLRAELAKKLVARQRGAAPATNLTITSNSTCPVVVTMNERAGCKRSVSNCKQ